MLIPHTPESWLALRHIPCADVRAPAEFMRGHIPGAHSVPLFSNEARALIGTLYKQSGKEAAVRLGFELIGPHINTLIEHYHAIAPTKEVRLYCARGGMRSGSVGHMLQLMGFRVHLLVGGYKAYRHYVGKIFTKRYKLHVLSGKTGSGKTFILHALAARGEQVIDLEQIARHKGSVFGALNEAPQPPQQIFENLLADILLQLNIEHTIWIEDESSRIGLCAIPHTFYLQMRSAPVIELRVNKDQRALLLREQYGTLSTDALIACVKKLEKHIGSQRSADLIAAVSDRDYRALDMLIDYYDRQYEQGLHREPRTIVPHEGTDKSFQQIAKELTEIS